MSHELTPSEDLMMEVLAARYRLGEQIWTFLNYTKPTARKLEARGLVSIYSGQVEYTYRVGLSAEGIKAWHLDRPYVSPAAKTLVKPVAQRLRELADELDC